MRRHDFDITFNLKIPTGTRLPTLKKWHIHQKNSLSLNGTVDNQPEQTIFRFPRFHLNPHQQFDVKLACIYDWGSKVWHTLEIAVAAIATLVLEHLPALAVGLWDAIHHR